MKIYTKSGDKGETQIYVDQVVRVSKSDAILECYGTLDELNAHVGLLTSQLRDNFTQELQQIQQTLFHIGFAISANDKLTEADIQNLEQQIDQMQSQLPAQTSFILPGGTQAAAQAHICRTVARRAERTLVAVSQEHQVSELCLQYINRLSDYFFVLARYLNHAQGVEDIKVR